VYPNTHIPRNKPHHYAWEKEYGRQGALWVGPAERLELGGRVLELGCGNGKGLKSISADELYAIDVSENACALARKQRPNAEIVCCDCCSLPFQDGFFDFVVARHVFSHLSEAERKKAVAEARRVLKTGGRLLFRDFAVGDLRYGKGARVEEDTFRRGNNAWYHYFSLADARELFKGMVEECLVLETSEKKFGTRKHLKGIFKNRGTREVEPAEWPKKRTTK